MEDTADTDRCEMRLAVSGVAKRLGEVEGEAVSRIEVSRSVMMGKWTDDKRMCTCVCV